MNDSKDKRDYAFCILPNSICRTSRLDPYDKAILIAILSCGDNAFPSYTCLEKWTGISRPRVCKAIKNLERLELVYRRKVGQKIVYITRWQDKKNDTKDGFPVTFNRLTTLTTLNDQLVNHVNRTSSPDELKLVNHVNSIKTHEED